MPDLKLASQIFDIVFHTRQDIIFASLLSGQVKAFEYDDQGSCTQKWTLRPTKKSCRGLAVNVDSSRIYAASKDKSIFVINAEDGTLVEAKKNAHEAAINRILFLGTHTLATGDDDGHVTLWDTRKESITSIRTYSHHTDFISEFLWLPEKRHLVATSGDGTLSVMDIRANKVEPLKVSEDQEDELLSIVSVKNCTKIVVGTQLGVLTIWDRKKGYGDCVDRFLGHPHSVDALAALTPDVIVTGSSDGLLRVVQILPNKLLGVIADHGEFPIERVKVDREGKWVASVSHDEILKLTNVENALADSDEEEEEAPKAASEEDSDSEPVQRKRRKKDRRVADKRKKSEETRHDPSFFSGL